MNRISGLNLLFVCLAFLLVYGAFGGAPTLAGDAGGATVSSVFRVEGMTCGGCEAGVKLSVKRLEGVKSVEASYKEGRATVTYDPQKVTPEEIVAAIERLGYAAELEEPRQSDDGAGS